LTDGKELKMLDPEDRALVTDLQDKIIVLLVEKQEASGGGDEALARGLQRKIDRLTAECEEIRALAAD
jgi:hypothetical protein